MGKSQARNPTHKQKAERPRAQYEHLGAAAGSAPERLEIIEPESVKKMQKKCKKMNLFSVVCKTYPVCLQPATKKPGRSLCYGVLVGLKSATESAISPGLECYLGFRSARLGLQYFYCHESYHPKFVNFIIV